MEPRSERCYRPLLTTQAVTLTIARKSLINTPDKENGRCVGSNLDNRRKDSCQSTELSRISFVSDDIC
jgi:hypothetical protein